MLVSVTLVLLLVSTTAADIARPRGVSLTKTSLYKPRSDGSWVCLDGIKTIRFLQVNDDFCDCADGSDEPGTSACTQGRFHCVNIGHRPLEIPSSRVNDGICDCCDASDEFGENSGQCRNTCQALGQAEQEKRKVVAELYKRGATKRAEMIAKGKQMRADREARRAELERRRLEQEAIKTEREALKRNAEAAEAEALEAYKEQQRENDGTTTEGNAPEDEGPQTMRMEAEASFIRYDVNKDGFVEVTELQVDMTLDRDRNGVVTVEEAKYFLDERDRIELESFVLLSWPRIKPMQMLSQGIFKPPKVDGEKDVDETNHNTPQEKMPTPPNEPHDQKEQNSHTDETGNTQEYATSEADDMEEEEAYEEDDGDSEGDIGEGSVQEVDPQPTPEYDPETQHLIDLANEARDSFAHVERELRDIEHEIKDIDEQNAKDYGPNDEYASLDGECFKFEDREYIYSLCPFDRASQKPRSGGSETTLGRWDQWVETDNSHRYEKQRYSHGASCWNGPQRSTVVQLHCALEEKITAVSEPNRCEYFFEFDTAAACDLNQSATDDEDRMHDEL